MFVNALMFVETVLCGSVVPTVLSTLLTASFAPTQLKYAGNYNAYVTLVCDWSSTMPTLSFDSKSHSTYNFKLHSKCACSRGCEGSPAAVATGAAAAVATTAATGEHSS